MATALLVLCIWLVSALGLGLVTASTLRRAGIAGNGAPVPHTAARDLVAAASD